jgi:Tfp pilus assembly protein PilN
MKRLQIDFSPPSWQRTVQRTSGATWLLMGVALLLCAGAVVLGLRLAAQQRADQARLTTALTRAKAPVLVAVAAPVTPISQPQAAAVNSAVMQLNLPWRALHDAVGAATPARIAMLSLEPDARRRSIKITAEAKSSDAMFAYLEALKAQELFTGVALTRHEINELDPNKPIRFQLEAEWSAP